MGAEDAFDDIKGRAKEGIGEATDNEELEREGKLDQMKATVKDKVSGATDKVGDKLKDLNRDDS